MDKKTCFMTINEWTQQENCNINGFSESMLDNVCSLGDQDQILFFRKLIELHRLGLYRLSIKKLERIIANPKDINIGIYNGMNITFKYCPNHPTYMGIFPLRRKENLEKNRILKQELLYT
jgi:hypothetical protein